LSMLLLRKSKDDLKICWKKVGQTPLSVHGKCLITIEARDHCKLPSELHPVLLQGNLNLRVFVDSLNVGAMIDTFGMSYDGCLELDEERSKMNEKNDEPYD